MKSSLAFVQHASMYFYDIKDSALSFGQRQIEGSNAQLGSDKITH